MKKHRPPVAAHIAYQERREQFYGNSIKDIFHTIHQDNLWGCDETSSGSGSTLHATRRIRENLESIIKNYRIKSLLDAPCGDFFWMSHVNLASVQYIGVDIVEAIIEQNQRRYRNRMENLLFFCLDICKDPLPKVELIFSRDCLVHFPFELIEVCLQNFKRSESTYLLTTTFIEHDKNQECELGDWRMLNLQAEPFCFPPPLELFLEGCEEAGGYYRDKSLGLWRLQDL